MQLPHHIASSTFVFQNHCKSKNYLKRNKHILGFCTSPRFFFETNTHLQQICRPTLCWVTIRLSDKL